ncbi:GNAT family N-acetyltransferase [Flavobacterium sp. W22_SRS_FP1]|uniref:GNAT family N-acetyltransferase n=1 Tax=Flavobacterium sp. W22_SRS_FP1 TaxID=3240276 RepID=UPI003F8ECA7A
MNVREATELDYDSIWDIFKMVIATADTYVFNPNTSKSDLRKHWLSNYMQTYVVTEDEKILGTYILKPNQIDLGDHIANCSYMVNPDVQGKGVGKLMCQHSIEAARESGFEAIQFNIVVSTNQAAVNLWKKFEFEIIGVTPKGFRHGKLGFVDTYIMYKNLK